MRIDDRREDVVEESPMNRERTGLPRREFLRESA